MPDSSIHEGLLTWIGLDTAWRRHQSNTYEMIRHFESILVSYGVPAERLSGAREPSFGACRTMSWWLLCSFILSEISSIRKQLG